MKNTSPILNLSNPSDGCEAPVMKSIPLPCYHLDLGPECVLVSLICKKTNLNMKLFMITVAVNELTFYILLICCLFFLQAEGLLNKNCF